MSFEKRFKEIIQKTPLPPKHHLWLNAFFSSFLVFCVFSLYLFSRRGEYDLYIANKAVAGTSLTIIGLSMALSGICYFWNRFDSKIIYRKHLGIIGFGYGLMHTVFSLFFLSDRFQFPTYFLSDNPHRISFFAALTAVFIFIIMTLISNKYAAQELGGVWWRRILRFGYVAYILIIIHLIALKYKGWISWIQEREDLLPPLGLPLFIFALFVIVLRIILEIAIRRNKKRPVVQSSYEAPQQQNPPNSTV